jgi:hypothetical protein
MAQKELFCQWWWWWSQRNMVGGYRLDLCDSG